MRCTATIFLLLISCTYLSTQSSVRGQVQDADGAAIDFANVALYRATDSTLVKVETTDESGVFRMDNVLADTYDLSVTYLGAPELRRDDLAISGDTDFGVLTMAPAGVELAEATVTARRALVEVKPDRTVFNVQGTINAVGNNGLELLRKAPGVTVDNNDNINVLSRSGVLLYVDGRRLPLSGNDLSNYLRNLDAEQIDRIDIITNPGARYEAEGNAGIIDIRLKKAEDEGTNGSLSLNGSQGRYFQGSVNGNGNFRNRWLNVFGNVGINQGESFSETGYINYQNGLRLDESVNGTYTYGTYFYRAGIDLSLSEKHTIGVLVGGRFGGSESQNRNVIDIFNTRSTPITYDSTLRAINESTSDRSQNTYNLNYRYLIDADRSLNVDLDYGRFRNELYSNQANRYYAPAGTPLTSLFNYFDTPRDIDITTAQLDYEQPFAGGDLDAGMKLSRVRTFNTFLFYEVLPDASPERILDDLRSNQFDYAENVYAGYVSYARDLTERWSFTSGLRMEITDATGDLMPFDQSKREDPVDLNYVSLFPNAGLTYRVNPRAGHTVNLAYGRRINRPDYNVLNPFRQQLSQLSYERGNPQLNPEIVDNIEIGYTHAYRYNFKLAYSSTSNQITRLIAPDDTDQRASFISWENLANQEIYSFNASAPVQLTEKWNLYVNASASHINNQADYGDGAVVDLQAFTYSFYVQNTLNLPGDFTAEIGGYFSGPGVWGGVFRYNEMGALNVGLQRKFLNEQLNVKLSGNDLFYTSNWEGGSEFAGLRNTGYGQWDSRRVALSLSYNFGNQKVKSRRRKTGIDEAADRVSE